MKSMHSAMYFESLVWEEGDKELQDYVYHVYVSIFDDVMHDEKHKIPIYNVDCIIIQIVQWYLLLDYKSMGQIVQFNSNTYTKLVGA